MNAVRDFLNDPSRLADKLAIPTKIRTGTGYLVDTSGPVWMTPPGFGNMNWGIQGEIGALLRTHQAYAAALLDGRSESTAINFYSAFNTVAKFDGWRKVELQWLTCGVIDFPLMLALKKGLFEENPKTAWRDYGDIRRWYYWAHGLRIPGFSAETVDRLKALNKRNYVPFVVQQQITPGAPRSRASKNRRCYTDTDFARIQSALLRMEGKLRSGEILFSTRTEFSSLPANIKAALLKGSLHIGYRHLVVGWLACMFGDRPKAFTMLRESDFEFFEADGVKVGTVRFSDEVKRSYGRLTKPAKRAALPLNAELVRLVPKLLEENRVWAKKRGIDPHCDLPLFQSQRIKSFSTARMSHEDEAARMISTSTALSQRPQDLFGALNVKTSDGTVIVPTFYSFRDGNHTRWARKMPLDSVAAITGKKGIESFKHYMKPGIRHIARLDEVTEYTELAEYLQPPVPTKAIAPQARIPAPFPYAEEGALRVGVEGGCGCFGGDCPMAFDGSADCYVCHAFTPAVEGPHEWTLKVLVDRKTDMIARGLPRSEWTRYDRHIAAVGRVIQLVQEWRLKHLDKECS